MILLGIAMIVALLLIFLMLLVFIIATIKHEKYLNQKNK